MNMVIEAERGNARRESLFDMAGEIS